MSTTPGKLGFNATWAMAVGGMIGGGIFSTLGVVVGIAGSLAWLSFVAAGLIALAAGYSYVKLAAHYNRGGGAFTFLLAVNQRNFAGTLAWVLIVGYVLTNAVYAVTFGEYLGHVIGLGPWVPRVTGIAIIALFILLNLRGVGVTGGVEILLVWFKVVALLGLASWGLIHWNPPALSQGVPDASLLAALFGAASVFMAYEGFQLLTYDYEDIDNPKRTLPRAVLSAIIVVILIYVMVALGTFSSRSFRTRSVTSSAVSTRTTCWLDRTRLAPSSCEISATTAITALRNSFMDWPNACSRTDLRC